MALAIATAGCPNSTQPSAAGMATYCNAITGSVVVALDATATANGGLRFSIASPPGAYPALEFFAELPGKTLLAMTYDETNGSGATTLVEEAPTGGITWTQASTETGDVGSFSLNVTDAGAALAIDGGTSWAAPQGTLIATLLPLDSVTDAGLLVLVGTPSAAGCPSGQ